MKREEEREGENSENRGKGGREQRGKQRERGREKEWVERGLSKVVKHGRLTEKKSLEKSFKINRKKRKLCRLFLPKNRPNFFFNFKFFLCFNQTDWF